MNSLARLLPNQNEPSRRNGDFAVDLSHELRCLLQSAVFGLGLLRQFTGDSPAAVQAFGHTERAVRRMSDLIESMVNAYRAEQGHFCPDLRFVDLDEVIQGAVETVDWLIRERSHRLTVRINPPGSAIQADAVLLSRVLVNLLENAAKFTEPGGTIELMAELDRVEVEIRIRDNGIGIEPEMVPHLFTRCSHREPSGNGMGLGLSLVRQIVELHGGSVQAFSAGSGQGSEFVVRLPRNGRQPGSPKLSDGALSSRY